MISLMSSLVTSSMEHGRTLFLLVQTPKIIRTLGSYAPWDLSGSVPYLQSISQFSLVVVPELLFQFFSTMQPPKQSSYVKSRWEMKLSRCSLPHFVFGSPQDDIENERKLVIDAARPQDRSLSLAEYRSLSVRVAVGLRRLGVQPKDRILCISGNSVCYSSLMMGTVMAGCVFVPGQPGHGDRELERLISAAKPSVILTQRANADTLLQAAKAASSPALARNSIFIFDDDILDYTGEPYLGISHWQDMVGSPTEDDWEYPDVQSSEDYNSTIVIMFTSGTTGQPKGVEVSHCSYISAATGYMARVSLHPDWQQSAQNTKDPSPVRLLGALGMHHLLGQRCYSVIFPKLGIPLYMLRQPNLEAIINAVERFQLTDAVVRSSLLTELANYPYRKNLASSLRSLKRAEGCAAPMPQSTKIALEGLGIGRVTRAWGLTEYVYIYNPKLTCLTSVKLICYVTH